VVSSSQGTLPDNTQQTNIYAPGGIRTHDRSRRAAVDLRLRSRGHWDRHTKTSMFPKYLISFFFASVNHQRRFNESVATRHVSYIVPSTLFSLRPTGPVWLAVVMCAARLWRRGYTCYSLAQTQIPTSVSNKTHTANMFLLLSNDRSRIYSISLLASQYNFVNSLEVWSSFGHTRNWSLSIIVFSCLHIVQWLWLKILMWWRCAARQSWPRVRVSCDREDPVST
jgi:hypothetical protein